VPLPEPLEPSPKGRSPSQNVGLSIAAVVGIAILLYNFDHHLPVKDWLFWRYASYVVTCACWNIAVLAFGHAVLRRLKRDEPTLEYLLFAMVVGVVAFYLAMFVAGMAGLYGKACFFVVPLVMFLIGAKASLHFLVVHRARLRQAFREVLPANNLTSVAVCAFGVVAVTALYLNVMLPGNISYDARWYHLGLAEQYVIAGRIPRFPQGWFMGAYPHLSSYLYTWAFLAPGTLLFDRVLLSAHLELVLFIWTLAGVGCLARAVLGDKEIRHAWVALFLFPGIFLYDSSLCSGADHILAFFAAPAYLALIRAWPSVDRFYSGMLALCLAAAVGTKYSAFTVVAFPCAVLTARAIYLTATRAAKREPSIASPFFALLTASVVGIVALIPLWTKNWAYYGDPLYPMLHQVLELRPWTLGMDYRYAVFRSLAWRPEHDMRGILETLKSPYLFSFFPNNWPWMHGKMPVFGSLFTVSALMLPFLRHESRRLWGIFVGANVGIVVWYWIQHEDRYLQSLLPWMASAVAVVFALAWRSGWLSRIAISLLAGVQIVWGLHVYFIPTHATLGQAPVKALADMAATVYAGNQKNLLPLYVEQASVGQRVGSGTLLLHNQQPQLGFGVRVLQDNAMNQGGIVYGNVSTPRQLIEQLRSYGVTHILWGRETTEESLADDIVFLDFVTNGTTQQTPIGPWTLTTLRDPRPQDRPFPQKVLLYPCPQDGYSPGFYRREDLYILTWDKRPLSQFPKPREPVLPEANRRPYLERADAVVINTNCRAPLEPWAHQSFQRLGSRSAYEIWRRR